MKTDLIILHAADTSARDAAIVAFTETIVRLAECIRALAHERQVEHLMQSAGPSRLVH
jgi:hypothetical protein